MDSEPEGMPVEIGSSEIILGAKIMPIYVGSLNVRGEEPMSSPHYERGMLKWDVMPNDEVIGGGSVLVPAGEWQWIIYTFHPTSPTFYAVERLAHALVFTGPSRIDLDAINGNAIQPWTALAGLP